MRNALFLFLVVVIPFSTGYAQLEDAGVFSIIGFSDQHLQYTSYPEGVTIDLGALGTTPNLMRRFGDHLYVVHSGDYATGAGSELWYVSFEEIVAAHAEYRTIQWNILSFENYSNPWDVFVQSDTIYVSLTGSGQIMSFYRPTGELLATLDGFAAPEGMQWVDSNLLVAESNWGDGNEVARVASDLSSIVERVTVGANPQYFGIDDSNNYHVLCSGRSWGTDPVAGCIYRFDSSFSSSEVLTMEGNPGEIAVMEYTPMGVTKVVLGDEYAVSAPQVCAYIPQTLVMDDSVPEGLNGGWALAGGSDGIFIGSSLTNSLQYYSFSWSSYETIHTFDGAVSDLLYYEGFEVDVRETDDAMVSGFVLTPSWPNPFNAITNLQYTVPMNSRVTIALYNQLGRSVQSLVRGNVNAGTHTVVIDASSLASGTYFVVANLGDEQRSQTITLVK